MRGSRGGVTACVAWLELPKLPTTEPAARAVSLSRATRLAAKHTPCARVLFWGGVVKRALGFDVDAPPFLITYGCRVTLSRRLRSTQPAAAYPNFKTLTEGCCFYIWGSFSCSPEVWLLDPTSGGGVESAKLTTISACLSSHPIPIPTPRRKGGAPSEARCA